MLFIQVTVVKCLRVTEVKHSVVLEPCFKRNLKDKNRGFQIVTDMNFRKLPFGSFLKFYPALGAIINQVSTVLNSRDLA